jgi:hypothetical protein
MLLGGLSGVFVLPQPALRKYNWILALIALFGMRRKACRQRSDINIKSTPRGIFRIFGTLKH